MNWEKLSPAGHLQALLQGCRRSDKTICCGQLGDDLSPQVSCDYCLSCSQTSGTCFRNPQMINTCISMSLEY